MAGRDGIPGEKGEKGLDGPAGILGERGNDGIAGNKVIIINYSY